MQRSNLLIFSALFLFLFSFSACNDDDMQPEEPVELITTLTYTLTPDGGGTPVVWTFRDLDGDGGDAPVITTSPLQEGVEYTGVITLLNETETPAEDISEEVAEEAEEHQFFFGIEQGLELSINVSDQDADGKPVGLNTQVAALVPGSGTVTIILIHEPEKDASGVANGDITNAGGEIDIEVTFDVVIE